MLMLSQCENMCTALRNETIRNVCSMYTCTSSPNCYMCLCYKNIWKESNVCGPNYVIYAYILPLPNVYIIIWPLFVLYRQQNPHMSACDNIYFALNIHAHLQVVMRFEWKHTYTHHTKLIVWMTYRKKYFLLPRSKTFLLICALYAPKKRWKMSFMNVSVSISLIFYEYFNVYVFMMCTIYATYIYIPWGLHIVYIATCCSIWATRKKSIINRISLHV